MTKLLLVGSIFFCSAVLSLLVYDYKRTHSLSHKEALQRKRKIKKISKNTVNQSESKNSSKQKEQTPLDDLQPIEKFSLQQAIIAKNCLEKNDIQGFVDAYAKIVSVQKAPLQCLEELSQFLPESAIIAIAQKAFRSDFLKQFPEKYGIHVLHDATSMRRVVKAARPFRAGETIFVMKPLVAYMNADCNEYDYCFTCKKFLIAEHIRCSRCCGFGYCNKKCEKLQQFHYLFCFPREKNNMENCPDLSGRLKDLKFFSEEKKKSMSQSKRFFYQLQELARTSKRPIFYAIAPLYAMVEQNESDEQFRDAFSHLYIPTPMPNASKLSKEEHNLMNKFINPSNDNLEFYIALVCKLLYNQLSFQSKPSSNGTFVNSGKGLYPCASFFDHSCSPNVHMFSASGTSELTFVASQHIQENELMTINYLENPRLTGEERRKILHSTFDFNCDCLLCKEDLKTQ